MLHYFCAEISSLTWCRLCMFYLTCISIVQVTPVVPLSSDSWNLSFAKYLDLRFNCSSFRRRGCDQTCPHPLHTDHYQYFGHRDIVASFKLVFDGRVKLSTDKKIFLNPVIIVDSYQCYVFCNSYFVSSKFLIPWIVYVCTYTLQWSLMTFTIFYFF